jgi:hypothetical protein
MSTWLPIESSPRDGTEILASDYDSVEIVSFDVHPSGMGKAWFTREDLQFFPAWWIAIPDQPLLSEEQAP